MLQVLLPASEKKTFESDHHIKHSATQRQVKKTNKQAFKFPVQFHS